MSENSPVRLLPMSPEESDDCSIEEVQSEYFLCRLPAMNGEYRCRSVLDAPPGSTVLFQYRAKIIASATLLGDRSLARPDRNGYTSAMMFDPASIRVFEPVGAKAMRQIWSKDFRAFGNVKQKLSNAPLERFFATARPPQLPSVSVVHRLARVAYNTANWHHPTGDAGKLEGPRSFNRIHGFGHEEWLFRSEWEIGGWRYGFLQAVNKGAAKLEGQTIDVSLFTILPSKERRFVAQISDLEVLTKGQAALAFAEFKRRGWYRTMRKEVRAVDGNENALTDKCWAPHVLNVRFRATNAIFWNTPPKVVSNNWLKRRWRYRLYEFPKTRVEELLPTAKKSSVTGGRIHSTKPHMRRGISAVEITPEHAMMQEKLRARLIRKYGKANVFAELQGVDLCVRTPTQAILYEIKSDASPRSVIREALGQIVEYAFYQPGFWNGAKMRLVIVGRNALGTAEDNYLKFLQGKFNLPIEYEVVPI